MKCPCCRSTNVIDFQDPEHPNNPTYRRCLDCAASWGNPDFLVRQAPLPLDISAAPPLTGGTP